MTKTKVDLYVKRDVCCIIKFIIFNYYYTLWISRWIAAARERIPGRIDNDVTGVSECSQQRGNLKDDGYMLLETNI
ncbi:MULTISPECIES: hypothetical protein [Photorhabdus]|uniref:Uncharacterized protein n=2 Tax=Photorhabdus TaxID=29487 RepID=A0ABX0AZ45_9GAMM|nr:MULTISPECIES: hypothetical protein [Photorhabdus]MCC8375093.1 hypothetical protein [Photorhabdus bodei]MCT8353827.1 hypothetical protein [Photorhabdus kayaii]MDB6367726.1 hypothetical protein [Photorhabdus bodei]MDB6371315.1 hypothetical protein [Photorhabdus bodei]NDL11174.1 hypothetical protein [Photorhabdus kayaii]